MIWIQLKYKVKNKIRYLQSITIQKRPSISFINFHQKYKNIYRFTNFLSTIYRLFIIFNTIQLFLISRLRTLLFKNLHLNKERRPLLWPALLFLYSSLRMTVSSTIRRGVLLRLRRNRSFRNCWRRKTVGKFFLIVSFSQIPIGPNRNSIAFILVLYPIYFNFPYRVIFFNKHVFR